MIKPGEIQKFKVGRKTDIGYILLTNEQEEVFLHNNETNYKELKQGQTVDAFLFFDNKQRLAATLYNPIIIKDQSDWLVVSGVHEKMGVFLNNNINKDILFSKDDLPLNTKLWPKIGEKLFVKLVVNKNFLAKPSPIRVISLPDDIVGQVVSATVISLADNGINLLTDDFNPIYVESTQLRRSYRVGEKVDVTINFKHESYYSGSLIQKKENQMLDDANIILNHLRLSGQMNLTNDSTPEEIKEVFNMSKKAFKRALGTLYKQRSIDFVNNKTILVGDKNE